MREPKHFEAFCTEIRTSRSLAAIFVLHRLCFCVSCLSRTQSKMTLKGPALGCSCHAGAVRKGCPRHGSGVWPWPVRSGPQSSTLRCASATAQWRCGALWDTAWRGEPPGRDGTSECVCLNSKIGRPLWTTPCDCDTQRSPKQQLSSRTRSACFSPRVV